MTICHLLFQEHLFRPTQPSLHICFFIYVFLCVFVKNVDDTNNRNSVKQQSAQSQKRFRFQKSTKTKERKGGQLKGPVGGLEKPTHTYRFEYPATDDDEEIESTIVVPSIPGIKTEKSPPPLCFYLFNCICK